MADESDVIALLSESVRLDVLQQLCQTEVSNAERILISKVADRLDIHPRSGRVTIDRIEPRHDGLQVLNLDCMLS